MRIANSTCRGKGLGRYLLNEFFKARRHGVTCEGGEYETHVSIKHDHRRGGSKGVKAIHKARQIH